MQQFISRNEEGLFFDGLNTKADYQLTTSRTGGPTTINKKIKEKYENINSLTPEFIEVENWYMQQMTEMYGEIQIAMSIEE